MMTPERYAEIGENVIAVLISLGLLTIVTYLFLAWA